MKVLLTDGDLTVRQKATECLFVIGGKKGIPRYTVKECQKCCYSIMQGADDFKREAIFN